jgi:hypothetical protein
MMSQPCKMRRMNFLVAISEFFVDKFSQTEFYRDDKIPDQLITDFKKAGLI